MWPNLKFPADLVAFTEEILNGKLHFLFSVSQKANKYDDPSICHNYFYAINQLLLFIFFFSTLSVFIQTVTKR